MLKVSHPCMRRILSSRVPTEGNALKLFQNDLVVTRNTVIADFVEADFDGYASQNPTWLAPIQNGAENVALADACTFTAGAGIAGPQTIYGYFFLNEDGDYSWGETFEDGPVTMVLPGQELVIFPQFKDKNYGE